MTLMNDVVKIGQIFVRCTSSANVFSFVCVMKCTACSCRPVSDVVLSHSKQSICDFCPCHVFVFVIAPPDVFSSIWLFDDACPPCCCLKDREFKWTFLAPELQIHDDAGSNDSFSPLKNQTNQQVTSVIRISAPGTHLQGRLCVLQRFFVQSFFLLRLLFVHRVALFSIQLCPASRAFRTCVFLMLWARLTWFQLNRKRQGSCLPIAIIFEELIRGRTDSRNAGTP